MIAAHQNSSTPHDLLGHKKHDCRLHGFGKYVPGIYLGRQPRLRHVQNLVVLPPSAAWPLVHTPHGCPNITGALPVNPDNSGVNALMNKLSTYLRPAAARPRSSDNYVYHRYITPPSVFVPLYVNIGEEEHSHSPTRTQLQQ